MRPYCRHLALETFEPDLLFEAVAATGFEHRLLRGGSFAGQLDRVLLPNCRLDRGYYSLSCFAKGAVPEDWIMIGLSHGRSEPAWVNGYEVKNNHIQIYAEDTPIDFRSSPTAPWYALQVRREFLQQHVLTHSNAELDLPLSGSINLCVSEDCASSLRRMLTSIVEFGNELNRVELATIAKPLELELFTCVETTIRSATRVGDRNATREYARHSLIRLVENLLANRLGEPFRMNNLVSEVDASERTIERMVKSVYGISPRRLFIVAQMNQIRRELLTAGSHTSTVEAIANKWGVTNLGRFAGRYRAMFGERPYETMVRR